MALPTSYLTSFKNLAPFFDAIRSAQAPDKFTLAFLESLEFKSSADRLFIPLLKMLGLLDDAGRPTERYFRFLDRAQSGHVLADAIREAYQDLFRVNVNAQNLTKAELINKFKTLSQGKINENVLDRMASTFITLSKLADFSAASTPEAEVVDEEAADIENGRIIPSSGREPRESMGALTLGGLVYNIQLILPETRDPAVYDALFQSLRRHLT